MGKKIDELESSIGELVQEAQNESDAPAQKHWNNKQSVVLLI